MRLGLHGVCRLAGRRRQPTLPLTILGPVGTDVCRSKSLNPAAQFPPSGRQHHIHEPHSVGSSKSTEHGCY